MSLSTLRGSGNKSGAGTTKYYPCARKKRYNRPSSKVNLGKPDKDIVVGKSTLHPELNQQVLFEDGDKFHVGQIIQVDENSVQIKHFNSSKCVDISNVHAIEQPRHVDLQIGSVIFVALFDNSIDTGTDTSTEVRVCRLTSIGKDSAYAKLSVESDEVKIAINSLFCVPSKILTKLNTTALGDEHSTESVAQNESQFKKAANVLSAILTRMRDEYRILNNLYENAKCELTRSLGTKAELTENLLKLNETYLDSIEDIKVLQAKLLSKEAESSQQTKHLLFVVSEQQKEIDIKDANISSLKQEIRKLKVELEVTKRTSSMRTEILLQENARLREENDLLINKKKNDDILIEKSDVLLKQKDNEIKVLAEQLLLHKKLEMTDTDGKVLARSLVSGGRSSTFVKVPKPTADKPSSSLALSDQLLHHRAKCLKQFLVEVSAKVSPTDDDLARTLAQFAKENPQISLKAVNEAKITAFQGLSPGDCVDLKLLLKIPMYKFRNLRAFLQNHGVSILASEQVMRDEMSKRVNNAEIEVAIVYLKKKSSSQEETKVALVRVQSPKEHIKNVIKLHSTSKQLDLDKFDNEIYLKLGGDKGGETTKIVYQIANLKKGMKAEFTEVLALFAATDNMENLWKVVGKLKEELSEIHGYKVSVNENIEAMIRVFLYGDYDFLCKVMGHQGASASFPCLWCLCPLGDLSLKDGSPHCKLVFHDHEYISNDKCIYEPRSVEMYHQDFVANVSEGGNLNSNGKFHHSIVNDMLLKPKDLDHVCPIVLHIQLGLVLKYYNMLESLCRELDRDVNMKSVNSDLYDDWQLKIAIFEQSKLDVEDAKDKMIDVCDLLKRVKESRSRKSKANKCCSALICISCDDRMIMCDQCEKWLHPNCIGMPDDQYSNFSNSDSIFHCIECTQNIRTLKGFVQHFQLEYDISEKNVIDMTTFLKASEAALNEVYIQVEKDRGPMERELDRILDDELHIQRQAYHSHSFVGNHCTVILKKHDKLVTVLDDYPELKDKFKQLFMKFAEIYFLMSKCDFLTETEIDRLCHMCNDFGQWFPQSFPSETLTVKFHILIFHVPAFARKWKSVGIFSEQSSESIHAIMNSFHRTFQTIRAPEKQLKLVYTHHSMLASTNGNNIARKKRKCDKCHSFMSQSKMDKTKSKHCPRCEPELF